MTPSHAPALADLRREIDRIDEAMHRMLMERGEIIDRLIAVKKTSDLGSAFRPGREASMMRALAERHRGLLPLDTVEGIWRVIIATFTYVQAPFGVHADVSGGDAPMRDSARFHFGFTVPYWPHPSAVAVIEAVARSRGDLGIFRLDQGVSAGAWWRGLVGEGRPKIIARFPFIERPDHPAGTPVFVVANPLAEAAVRDVTLYSARFERWREPAREALAALGGDIIASAGHAHGLAVLLALPGAMDGATAQQAVRDAGAELAEIVEVGSHAERFRIGP
jgi:chorismate mutase